MQKGWLLGVSILLAVSSARGEPTPNINLDADYGSVIHNNGDVEDAGQRVLHHLDDNGVGYKWQHSTTEAFMGERSYYIRVGDSPGTSINDRSEQKLVRGLEIGGSQKYYTFALYVPSSTNVTRGWVFPTQWWQHTGMNPTLFVSLTEQGDFEFVQRTMDNPGTSNQRRVIFTEPLVKTRWHYFMVRVEFGIDNSGSLVLWKMNLDDGGWDELYRDESLTVGYKYTDDGTTRRANTNKIEWKMGQYRASGNDDTRVYLDNIRVADSWDEITNFRSLGHFRNLVSLNFDETGSTAQDSSGSWNDGWSFSSHGQLIGATKWLGGRQNGSCVLLDGVDDYVRVPIDESWFETGNYLSLAAHFATSAEPDEDGLVVIDRWGGSNKDETFKARLELKSSNEIVFAVRHPDQSISSVTYSTSESFSNWHWWHVVGTFNRFAPDGQRLKLYIKGQLVASSGGADKAVLTGEKYLHAGQYSTRHFEGVLDDVAMFNFALTSDDVATYHHCLWNESQCQW